MAASRVRGGISISLIFHHSFLRPCFFSLAQVTAWASLKMAFEPMSACFQWTRGLGAIENHRHDGFFRQALGLCAVALSATLSHRLDGKAVALLELSDALSIRLLKRFKAPITPLVDGSCGAGQGCLLRGQLRYRKGRCLAHLCRLRRLCTGCGLSGQQEVMLIYGLLSSGFFLPRSSPTLARPQALS